MDVTATFDDSSPNWVDDQEQNEMFLMLQQNFFNYKLEASGYVFLNDVLQALGLQTTRMGQTHGWALFMGNSAVIDFRPVFLVNGDVTLQFQTQGDILDAVYPLQEV
jgi:hypothetical protein